MSLTEKLKHSYKDIIGRDNLKFQIGDGHPRRMTEAISVGTYLGNVVINTEAGMLTTVIQVPRGVTAVNSDYILHKIEHNNDRYWDVTPHDEAGRSNRLTIGKAAAVHPIAPGCVFITDASSFAKFEGETLEGQEFVIPRSPNMHYDPERDEVKISEKPVLSRGRGSR